MYAVLDDRNQQYRVAQGDKIKIHLKQGDAIGDAVAGPINNQVEFIEAKVKEGPVPGNLFTPRHAETRPTDTDTQADDAIAGVTP